MGNQVKFVETTQNTYNTLVSRESGTLYFTTDTKRIYKGNNLFASELTPVYEGGTKFSDWTITRDEVNITNDVAQPTFANGTWTVENVSGDGDASPVSGLEDDISIVWTYTGDSVHQYVATRSENKFLGYAIAGQTGQPLAPASHVHPAETEVEYSYSLPSNLLPITFKYAGTSMSANSILKIEVYDNDKLALYPPSFPAIAVFDKKTGVFLSTSDPAITDMAFGGTPSDSGVWPILDISTTSIQVRGEPVQLPLSSAQLANIAAVSSKASKPTSPTNGNLASLNASGDLVDSGMSATRVSDDISRTIESLQVLWYDDNSQYTGFGGATAPIYFRPREVGMLDGGGVSVLNIHTAPEGVLNVNVYVKLLNENNQVLATSDIHSLNVLNAWIPFTFNKFVPLLKDSMYRFVFYNSSTDQQNQLRLTLKPNADSPDLYFNSTVFRPHITVRWLMDMNKVKQKLVDYESRIGVLETALSGIETALQQINNGGQS